jgi:hypothetical protein
MRRTRAIVVSVGLLAVGCWWPVCGLLRRTLLAAPAERRALDLRDRAVTVSKWLTQVVGPATGRAVSFVPEYDLPPGGVAAGLPQPEAIPALAALLGAQARLDRGVYAFTPAYSRGAGPDELVRFMRKYPDVQTTRFLTALDDDTWAECYPSRWVLWSRAPSEVVAAINAEDPSIFGLLEGAPRDELTHLEFSVVPRFRVSVRYRGVGICLEHCLWQRYRNPELSRAGRTATYRSAAAAPKPLSLSAIDARYSPAATAPKEPSVLFPLATTVSVARSPLTVAEVCGALAAGAGRKIKPSKTIEALWTCLIPGEYDASALAAALASALQLQWRTFQGDDLLFLADDTFEASYARIRDLHDDQVPTRWRGVAGRLFTDPEVQRALQPFAPADFLRFVSIPFHELSGPQQTLVLELLAGDGLTLTDEQKQHVTVVCYPDIGLFFRPKGRKWAGSTPETMLYRLMSLPRP